MPKNNFTLISPSGKRFELTKTSSPQVDPQRCINCGECLRLCPTGAITQRQREICKICPNCTNSVQLPREITEAARKSCSSSCPINMVPQSYINLIAEERFEEAFRLIKQHTPLPAICGYICHHPCEEECKRGGIDEPVAIRALKRFVADRELKDEDELDRIGSVPKIWDEEVAIIGSGPAGPQLGRGAGTAGHAAIRPGGPEASTAGIVVQDPGEHADLLRVDPGGHLWS